jgi:predicted nucleic acid-binding protein
MIVCLDANIVIYLLEKNPLWEPKASARIAVYRAAGDEIAVCDAARLECLAGPLQTGNAADLASYTAFFAGPSPRMLPVTVAVWERAALISWVRSL